MYTITQEQLNILDIAIGKLPTRDWIDAGIVLRSLSPIIDNSETKVIEDRPLDE